MRPARSTCSRAVHVAFGLALVIAGRDASATEIPLTPAMVAGDEALLHEYATTVESYALHAGGCDMAIDVPEGEIAHTIVDVEARSPYPDVDKALRFIGRPRFSIVKIVVRIPGSITWPRMTQRDRIAVEGTIAALRHHEAGHVRVAVAEIGRLNAAQLVATPDPFEYRRLIDRRSAEGLTAITRAQVAYDELTDHGRRQDRAPGDLAGPRTMLSCTTP